MTTTHLFDNDSGSGDGDGVDGLVAALGELEEVIHLARALVGVQLVVLQTARGVGVAVAVRLVARGGRQRWMWRTYNLMVG